MPSYLVGEWAIDVHETRDSECWSLLLVARSQGGLTRGPERGELVADSCTPGRRLLADCASL